jgi:hypothetical protein
VTKRHPFDKAELVPREGECHPFDKAELVPREGESVFSLPFLLVPPRATARTSNRLQEHFKAKRFCVYADDSTKLRVELWFGCQLGGTSSHVHMPAGLFADGPTVDRSPFVLHCSECGAPTKDAEPKCRHCGAPFTWRVTETAYGQSGLALDFPMLGPGVELAASFTNRSDKAVGVDAAFVGQAAWRLVG